MLFAVASSRCSFPLLTMNSSSCPGESCFEGGVFSVATGAGFNRFILLVFRAILNVFYS